MSRKTRQVITVAALLVGGCAPQAMRELPPVPLRPWPTYLRAQRPPSIAPVVVVDAGHGGRDAGARGVGPVPEKHINISIARRLAEQLRRLGSKVITTRTADEFVALDERAAIAQRSGADLFISIHADSAPRASASGATIYIARNASRQSVEAAEHIASALRQAGIACRGVRRAGFRVLVDHSRPAVLVECGYLTNRAEARKLSTSAYQARIADVIARGIAEHFRR